MRKLFFLFFIFLSSPCFSQPDTTKWLRAFPVTDYMVTLNDSIRIVQIQLPDGYLLKEQQLGLIRGVYKTTNADTVQKGYGKCHLIKGNYYYFSIGHNKSGVPVKEGDLLYTFVERPSVYRGQIVKLASHCIELQTVYETSLYNPNAVFHRWDKADETALVDSIVDDIKFTGNYFIQNNPAMDKLISSGNFKGKKTLTVMAECQPAYVRDFLDYVLARPRLYAGRKWKISEIFATWALEGAPTVIKD